MAANDPVRLPDRIGATQFLLCHIWGTSLIRQLSVVKDFNPGGPPLSYFSLLDDMRTAIQFHITQLNRNSVEPRQAVWAVHSVYHLRGELLFIAENLTIIPRAPPRRRDPILLLHLAAQANETYALRSQLVVSSGFQPIEAVYPYFSVTKFWRKAIKTELQRLNSQSDDLSDHAWALASIHSVTQGKPAEVVGVVLVVQWMSCETGTEQPTDPLSTNFGTMSLGTGAPSIPMIHSNRPSPRHEPERDAGLLPPYSLS